MPKGFTTKSVSVANAEVVDQVIKDVQDTLHIPVSFSEVQVIMASAYFDLKKLKAKERQNANSNVPRN